MADELHYASGADANKRKYDDTDALTTPSPERGGRRRPTGFSSPHSAVGLPSTGIESAKLRAQEIASRLFNDAEAKRPKFDNGGYDSPADIPPAPKPLATNVHVANTTPSLPDSYGYQGMTKKIDIPNGRVGVIIGKGGETIKYLQLQSGAKIQVTRDMDADPNSSTRTVDLVGTPDQITKAEQLISDVLAEAESGGSAVVSRRLTGQAGSEQFSMMVPNNKVGLVIGKGGETIKSIQARSGARVQVIPLHPPPGDTSTERTVQIDGSAEQVEAAKLLVNEVISENRPRNSSMGGGYPQQGYQARGPSSWASRPPQQQPGYGHVQPGAYPGSQYGAPRPQYPSYPQQTGTAYPTSWDPSSTVPAQQPPPSQGTGYDYYNQPPQQQASGDNSYYNYNQQPPTSGYNTSTQQNYPQDPYGAGYQTQAPYSQPLPNPNEQQGYNNPAQAPPPPQASPLGQPGYGNQQPPTQGGDYSTAYGAPPPPHGQKPYGQPQLSPSQGYVNPQGPPPAHSGYAQPPPSGYGASPAQPGAYPTYGAPTYGHPPPVYGGGAYGGAYAQAPAYAAVDGNAGSNGAGPSPAVEPNSAAKAPAPESK